MTIQCDFLTLWMTSPRPSNCCLFIVTLTELQLSSFLCQRKLICFYSCYYVLRIAQDNEQTKMPKLSWYCEKQSPDIT